VNKEGSEPRQAPGIRAVSLGAWPREPPDPPEDQRPHRSDADHSCEQQRPQDDEVTLAVECGGDLGTPGWGLPREQGKEARRLA
jgi:hypothetical protein